MNANYIYDIFETCKTNDLPDLIIALAQHKDKAPIPEGMTEKGINQFMGRHYDKLVEAYKTGSRGVFSDVVRACVQEDEEQKEA